MTGIGMAWKGIVGIVWGGMRVNRIEGERNGMGLDEKEQDGIIQNKEWDKNGWKGIGWDGMELNEVYWDNMEYMRLNRLGKKKKGGRDQNGMNRSKLNTV